MQHGIQDCMQYRLLKDLGQPYHLNIVNTALYKVALIIFAKPFRSITP